MNPRTWICLATIAAVGLTSPFQGTILNALSLEFSLSLTVSGALLLMIGAGFFLSSLGAGVLSDIYGKRLLLMLSLILLTSGSLLAALTRHAAGLFAAFLIIGLALGGMESMSTAFIAELNPERPGMVINFSQVFFGAGALTGPLLAAWLASYNWRLVYVCLIPLGLLLLAFLGRLSFPVLIRDDGGTAAGEGLPFRQPAFIMITLAIIFYVGTEAGIANWLALYMERSLKTSGFMAGLSLSLFWGAMMIGRIISGLASERVGYERLVLLCSSIGVVFLTAAVLSGSTSAAMIFFALTGLAYAPIWPTLVACAGKRYIERSGSVFGIIIAAGGLGSIIFPPLMGALADAVSLSAAIGSTSLLLLAIILLVARLIREETLHAGIARG